jgi:hypothetical protein
MINAETVKQALDLVYVGVLILVAIGSFFGATAFFTRKVNRNFDLKYEADKIERDAAKKEADEREASRMQAMINLQEGFVAVGHVASKTAEAHLAKCGPNKSIVEALETYNAVRAKTDAQTRQEAARYRERTAQ